MPTIRAFDTETTGLFPVVKSPYINDNPWALQISTATYNTDQNIFTTSSDYIRIPEHVNIPQESIDVHGITHEKLTEKGVDIKSVLEEFIQQGKTVVDETIAHNIAYDTRMLNVEAMRNNIPTLVFPPNKKYTCTMKLYKNQVGSKGRDKEGVEYIKYPKLWELAKWVFPEENIACNLHDSLMDSLVCLRCHVMAKYDIDMYTNNNEFKQLYDSLTTETCSTDVQSAL